MDGSSFSFPGRHDSFGIDEAIHGLADRAPLCSARHRLSPAQAIWMAGCVAVCGVVVMVWTQAAITAVSIGLACAFAALIVIRIASASLAAASTPSELRPAPPPAPLADSEPIYTVLCPLYREPTVVAQLLGALGRLDYPPAKLDVKIITEADDPETRRALHLAGLPNWAEIVITPVHGPRTKPKALNFALARARGEFVCVYDAEDDPDPAQLREALQAFEAGGARLGCVQAPLTIDNGVQSWIAGQFAAEYAIQFGQSLPFYAHAGVPFAIGGTSNHFRLAALREVGGWDPYNVTEDADLGFRMARFGWAMATITPPTIESAPTTLAAWVRQRTRWIKGHLQTWLVLMRDPVEVVRGVGLYGFLAIQAQLGGGILSSFAHGPLVVFLGLAAVSPDFEVSPAAWALASAGYASSAYGAFVSAVTARNPALLRAAMTMPLYWPLASIAALCALIELIRAPHYWAKTDHAPRAAPDESPACPSPST